MLRRDSSCSLTSACDDVIINDECLSKAQFINDTDTLVDGLKFENEDADQYKEFDLIESGQQPSSPLDFYPSLYGKSASTTPYQNMSPTSRVIPRKRYIIISPSTASPSLSGLTSRNSTSITSTSFASLNQQPFSRALRSFATADNNKNDLNSVAVRVPHEIDIHSSNMRMQTPTSNKYPLKLQKRQMIGDRICKPTSSYFSAFAPIRRSGFPSASMVHNNEMSIDVSGKSAAYRRPLRINSYRMSDPTMKYSCPKINCSWRGPSQFSLNRHFSVAHESTDRPVASASSSSSLRLSSSPTSGPLTSPRIRPVPVSHAHTAPPSPTSAKVSKPKGVKCSECGSYAYSRPLLIKHMWKEHGIEAPIIHKEFDSREDLQVWLDSLRSTHAVEFVVSSGSKKWGRGLQVHYLTCSRSGEQKERPNKKFIRQPRPSIKCGRNCMAYLKIKQNPTVSTLQIEGCLHHSGHEIDATNVVLEDDELKKVGVLCYEMDKDRSMTINAGNMMKIRDALGYSGRFRLMTDEGLLKKLPEWVTEWRNYKINMNMTDFYDELEEERSAAKYMKLDEDGRGQDDENNELIKEEAHDLDEFCLGDSVPMLPDINEHIGLFDGELEDLAFNGVSAFDMLADDLFGSYDNSSLSSPLPDDTDFKTD